MNLKNFVNIGGELKTNHRIYSYVNDAEYITMNDMLADGFFNDVFAQLKVDDKIMVFDSAQYEILAVVSVTNGIVKTKKLNVSGGGSGGITEVVHDDTLSGDGTDDAPLKVVGGGPSTDNNGLEGDYATTYGIVDETTSGLPYIKAVGSTVVVIPAGLVLDVPGQSGLTTVASAIEYEVVSTDNPTLFLAQGTVIEATDVFFQTEEPEDGTTGYAAWWNGTTWQFKSNDTGNVWRPANAVRIAKTVFTDGSLTRLCFTGCRVLNKQEWLPLSGGTVTGTIKLKTPGSSYLPGEISLGSYNSINLKPGQSSTVTNKHIFINGYSMSSIGGLTLGDISSAWPKAYINEISAEYGKAIAVPKIAGTMVVATPPTVDGTYVLKTTVANGTITTEWVAE